MGEEAITSGRQKALREATILLDLAIIRSRGSVLNAGLRSRSRGAGMRPSSSLASSRSCMALQMVTLTRR
jgi:hypothetical protein